MADRLAPNEPFAADELLSDALARDPDLRGRLTRLGSIYSLFVQSDLGLRAERRVTLGDTARAAGNKPQAFIDFLNGTGLRPNETVAAPDLLAVNAEEFDAPPKLDVRNIIHGGKDPLGVILEFVDALDGPDKVDTFVLIAPFDPLPLRRLLGGRGWQADCEKGEGGDWRVLFRRGVSGGARASGDKPHASPPPPVINSTAPPPMYLDLRGLEPPQPMIEIIKFLEAQPPGTSVVAHLEREPVFLYPELTERQWAWTWVGDQGDSGFRLQITKPVPPAETA